MIRLRGIMKRTNLVYIIAPVVLLFYIFFINFVAYTAFVVSSTDYSTTNQGYSEITEGGDVKIGIGDSVGVSVVRNRWYGTIVEEAGKGSDLYMMGLVTLPLSSGGIGFVKFHILFLIVFVICLYMALKKAKKHDFERGFM